MNIEYDARLRGRVGGGLCGCICVSPWRTQMHGHGQCHAHHQHYGADGFSACEAEPFHFPARASLTAALSSSLCLSRLMMVPSGP